MKKFGLALQSFRSAILASMFAAVSVWASPVSLNTGDTLIENFDATSFVPFTYVLLAFTSPAITVDDDVNVVFFSGLNGTGDVLVADGGPLSSLQFGCIPGSCDGIFDGLFSVVIQDVTGSFDVNALATITTPDNRAHAVDGVPVGNGTSVPEPATLALVGVALAGLGFARRGKA